VRELEHAIEQAVVLASGVDIGLEDLPASVRAAAPVAVDVPDAAGPSDGPATFKDAKQRVVERFERQVIGEALARHHGNVSKAAEELGMYRQHLQVKLAEYKIDPEPYRKRES
jgi:DNA-binding NtrC family response regulator